MPANSSSPIADHLLSWYDVHARALPWRAPPGAPPNDPYRVWLSEIMLQQTTVVTVRPHFERFVERWPTVASLAAADEAEVMAAWAGLGYYSRARNLIACARAIVAEHGGRFPDTEAGLRALPGIGGYTAAAVAAIAFGRRAVVVDSNIERVVARLFASAEPLPAAKPVIAAHTDTITPDARAGDFAQAMMDLASAICRPRAPKCLLCPVRAGCRAHALGTPEAFPVRAPKPVKPQRHGTVFWLERDGAVLLVRRPPRGLLGGMRALPSGPWSAGAPGLADAPPAAEWRMLDARISHVFTHFRLELALAVAAAGEHGPAADGEWWPIAELDSAGLPVVFAKAARAIRSGR
ncbi:MAG TPA: A/G-specific adenine glycosylase [Sphingomonas sp.]|nr:A/G-specific adenine glycosylase [Sphingomonas sp.]